MSNDHDSGNGHGGNGAVPPEEPLSEHAQEPHPERSADALALRIYRFLQVRSRADQLAVFTALPSPARWSSPERANVAIRGLLACHDELGGAFSRRQYDVWRARQTRAREWPSSTFIRSQFRDYSWHSALDAASIRPAADIKARRLLATRFSDEDILRALKLFAEAYPPGARTGKAYNAFAREAATDPTLPDMPKAITTLLRRGESLYKRLLDAGFEDERDFRQTPTAHYGRRPRYTDDALKLGLVQASKALGVRVVPIVEYNKWRLAHSPSSAGSSSITRRFGSWRRALYAAGLTTEREHRHARHRENGPIATETALRFLAAAARDFGYPPRFVEYLRWRPALLGHPDFNHGSVPSVNLIAQRFDSDWQAALDAAAKVEPEPGLPRVDTKGMGTIRAPRRRR